MTVPAEIGERPAARTAEVGGVVLNGAEKLMIIGDAQPVSNRLNFARATPGVQVVEPVDLTDLMNAAAAIDAVAGVQRLNAA